jgi:hypothetical protein
MQEPQDQVELVVYRVLVDLLEAQAQVEAQVRQVVQGRAGHLDLVVQVDHLVVQARQAQVVLQDLVEVQVAQETRELLGLLVRQE